MQRIFPSLLCANLLTLSSDIKLLEPYVAGFHIDCMDFHFVPNLAFSLDAIQAIARIANKPLQIHLMVEYPERYLDRLKVPQRTRIILHPESLSGCSFDDLILRVREFGWSPSVALSPQQNPSLISSLKNPIDHILLMGVEPGFAGQRLIPSTYSRLQEIRQILHYAGRSLPVAVDGGVTQDTAQALLHSGATELIMGSALFSSDNPKALLEELNGILL